MKGQISFSDTTRIVLYTAADGKVTVDVLFAQDNFWLTQRIMAELFWGEYTGNFETSKKYLR